MIKSKFSFEEIEQAISSAPPAWQRQLLKKLPSLLKIPKADLALLKAAEGSFEFWDNSEDAIYDPM